MARCSAITQGGMRCAQAIVGPDGLCYAHSRRRREAAPRPGNARGAPAPDFQAAPSVAAGYRSRLERIAERLLDPEDALGVKSAQAATAALNACLRALTVEADLRERADLEPRLKRIEELTKWGA